MHRLQRRPYWQSRRFRLLSTVIQLPEICRP